MCGIAGLLRIDGRRAEPHDAARMIARLHHRGPDGSGVYADGPVALAHARLAIVDLAGGTQPMRSADGRYTITFNGEIFDHVEHRERMLREGRRFATRSDTEVILHLFEEMGPECVHAMNGQWALAIWDARARSLFLARDRVGVRPLFHARAGGTFAFASEIKALLALPEITPRLDPRAIDQIFTFWTAIAPRTPLAGIEELPPGCVLTVHAGGRVEGPRRWFDFSFAPDRELDDETHVARLRTALEDAAKLRLVRADVPVGAYLSGGLDSAAITGLVARDRASPLRTFSVAFGDAEYDESVHQRRLAAELGVEHRTVLATHEAIGAAWPDVVAHAETPLLRTAPAPLFLLSRLVRSEGFKVVLTGEGADEVLGGYDIFREAKVRRFCARSPASTRRTALFRKLYPWMPSLQRQSDAHLRAFFRARPEDLDDPFFSHRPRWATTAATKVLFSREMHAALAGVDAPNELRAELPAAFAAWEPLAQAQYLESRWLLPGYILAAQGDRMAMAHSVEARHPFLDPRVIHAASQAPARMKLRVLREKHLLERAVADVVPAWLRARPKQPYRAPIAACFFAEGRARFPWLEELLAPPRIAAAGVFEPDAVARLASKARLGKAQSERDGMALAGVISTQLFVERFLNGKETWS